MYVLVSLVLKYLLWLHPHVRCSDLYSLVLAATSLFKGNEESLFLILSVIFSSVIKKDFSVTSAFKRLRL